MRNLFAVAAALVFAVLFSLGSECGATHVRHSSLVYDNTITVYQSDSFAVPLFFTSNDTITGSFSVTGPKNIDLFVMNVAKYHSSPPDSANSVFARTDTSYADIFFSPQLGDTFYFDFVNNDPDSLRKVTLQVHRVYWDTTL